MIRKKILNPNILLDFILLIFLTIIFYFSIPVSTEKTLLVPKGSTKSIIAYLHSNDYDVNSFDTFFLRFIGKPQSGFLNMPASIMTKADFLYALSKSKAALKEVTLIPGETMYFFNQILSKAFGLKIEDLQRAFREKTPYKDGVIFADTYKLPLGADADFLIGFLVDKSMKKHKELALKVLGVYDEKRWFRYVSIASIIQKEAANVIEMPIVSAVIYNRIKKGMPLQMDGSLNYGKYSHTRVTPDRIRKDDTEFNTYKKFGIPKNPVGSVSMDAIKAAINPAKVDYLYFVKNKNGTHTFSKTFKQHRQNIGK